MINVRIFLIIFFLLTFFNTSDLWSQDFLSTIEKKFSDYKNKAPKERIYIITDRDVYAPGDLIWMNATVFDIHSPHKSLLSKELKIVLTTHESTEIFAKTYKVEQGGGNGFLQIPTGIIDGVYYLHGETRFSDLENNYVRKIVVKEKILPPFFVKASFPEKSFIPGDQINLTLEFLDFYNEPKRNVEYTIDFFDGDRRIPGTKGKTKKTGLATVSVKIPVKLKSGFFSYKVNAKSKGITASLTGRFPVLTDQIYVDFFLENGKLIHAMESRVGFLAYDGSESPLAIEADLLENGQSISILNSGPDGTGFFRIIPDIEKKYELQIKRPLLLDNKLSFPKIEARGIGLKVISKSSERITYQLLNGYQSTRLVYFVGVSNGEMFWKSEHGLDRTVDVEVDLSVANGRLAHFAVINAAERIEGEHCLIIPGREEPELVEITTLETSTYIRGDNSIVVKSQDETGGKVIFSAVNSAWINSNLKNQKPQSIAFPVDFSEQLVFQSTGIDKITFSDEALEKFIHSYVPHNFGWEKVLGGRSTAIHENCKKTNPDLDQLTGSYYVENSDGKIIHHNLSPQHRFATANPKFLGSLYREKKNKTSTYQELLANGTPIMDVLQIIKPYSLEGSNIVFISSAISISSPSGALIIIDGINSGTNAAVIQSLNPLDVKSIRVSTEATEIQRYSSFNTAGVIEIVLKDGAYEDNESTTQDQDTQFSAPEYKRGKSGPEDFRSTLFWQIIPIGKEEGNAKITYYNSDLISKVKGVVYFIPDQGVPLEMSFDYEME